MKYDLIIIGSGVSGLAAAIYARRFNMSTLVIGELPGGTITQTHLVENYPGFEKLSGFELGDKILKHAEAFGTEMKNAKVTSIKKLGDLQFEVSTEKEVFTASTILIATGTEHRKLGIPGEAELTNKGVSYCATCDGPFFRDQIVGMVGGSDSAVKESLLLSEFAKKVYIIYRGEKPHPEPVNEKRMEAIDNIEVINNTNVLEVIGTDKVEKVKLDNGTEMELGGLFIEVGRIPQTDLVKDLGVELSSGGEIITDRVSRTNVEGVFAAGDVTSAPWKQAITGVAEGVHAAHEAYELLQSKK